MCCREDSLQGRPEGSLLCPAARASRRTAEQRPSRRVSPPARRCLPPASQRGFLRLTVTHVPRHCPLKALTLLCLPKGKKDTFVLSNKVIQSDGHSRVALCHKGPDELCPSWLTTFPAASSLCCPVIHSALPSESPPR